MSQGSPPRDAGKPAVRTVPCPTCGAKAAFEPWNPWRPFCSERCRKIDLGAWASEEYRISAEPGENETPDPPEDTAN